MVAVMAVEGYRLDDSLKGVDELCARWAREAWDWPPRAANPIYRAMKQREGASLPGGPEVMSHDVEILCRILANAEPRYYAVVTVWYIRRDPVMVKARRLGTNRTDLYSMWRRTLEYLRGRLHAEGVNV